MFLLFSPFPFVRGGVCGGGSSGSGRGLFLYPPQLLSPPPSLPPWQSALFFFRYLLPSCKVVNSFSNKTTKRRQDASLDIDKGDSSPRPCPSFFSSLPARRKETTEKSFFGLRFRRRRGRTERAPRADLRTFFHCRRLLLLIVSPPFRVFPLCSLFCISLL